MTTLSFLEEIKILGQDPALFLAEAAENSISFVTSPGGIAFLAVKIVLIIFSVALLAAIIYFLTNTNYLQFRITQDLFEFFNYRPYGAKKMTKTWRKMLARLDLPQESEHKLAIIEADDLLDGILQRLGYGGGSLKERLAGLTEIILPSIDRVREAHDIRNSIVHDPDYHLTLEQAKKLLEIYEQALRELQALE